MKIKYTKSNSGNGFTIVELLVVVVVMSILLSITSLAYVSIQKSSRDSSKEAKVKSIAYSLEAYYDKNNEYPSVASIAAQPQSTASAKLLLGDPQILEFPDASAGSNAIVSANPTSSQLLYEGLTTDSNATSQCQTTTTGYCDAFKLTYIKEVNGALATIKSRRAGFDAIVAANNAAPDAPSQPTVYGQKISSSVVRFTAGSATCTTGNVEYKIRYSTSSTLPDWSNYAWSTATTTDINPGSNTTYYSQSMARCNTGSQQSGSSISTTDYLDFTPAPTGSAPSTPSVSATGTSTSSISVSWSNPSGATYYNIYYGSSSANTSASCGSSPCTISGLSSGTYYYVSVYACNSYGCSGPGNSGASTQSPTPTGTAPSTPSPNVSMGYDTAQVSWSGVSGTTPISYSVRYGTSSPSTTTSCSSSPCTISGLSMSTSYQFSVSASNSYGSSTGSTSGTTLSPSLNASGSSMNGYGVSNITWAYTPSSYAPSNASWSVNWTNRPTGGVADSCGTAASTRSCSYDFNPCKFSPSMTVSDGLGRSDSFTIPAFVGTKPTINLNGSSRSGNSVMVRWNYGGDITWVTMRRNNVTNSTTSYIDFLSEGSGGSGSYNDTGLTSGKTYSYTMFANNCRYRGPNNAENVSYPSNYDSANTDTSSNFSIP